MYAFYLGYGLHSLLCHASRTFILRLTMDYSGFEELKWGV